MPHENRIQEARTQLFAVATAWVHSQLDALRCPDDHSQGIRVDSTPIAVRVRRKRGRPSFKRLYLK